MAKDTDYLYHLVNYIRKNLKKGYTKDSLMIALTTQGYTRISIENAFKIVEDEMAKKAPKLETRPKITREIIPLDKSERKSLFRRFFG